MMNRMQTSRTWVFLLILDVLFTAYRVSLDGRWIGLYATGLSLGWSVTGLWLLLKIALPFLRASHRPARFVFLLVGLELALGCGLGVYDVLLFAQEPCACTPVPGVVWIRLLGNGVILGLWMYVMNRSWFKRRGI